MFLVTVSGKSVNYGFKMPVRQSAESGTLRNSAVELKPNPNAIPDFKPPFLTLTLFCVYILHSTFYQKPRITQLIYFAVFRDITKQVLTVSLDQHSGHNFSMWTLAPVNICIE